MRLKVDTRKHNNYSRKQIVTCLLVFLAFITFNVFGSVKSIYYEIDDSISEMDSRELLQADNLYTDFKHFPLNLPVEPKPVPGEQDNTDEKVNVEEDEWSNSLSLSTLLRSVSIFKSAKTASDQFLRTLANRKQKPLFIFHCSWKSFLLEFI